MSLNVYQVAIIGAGQLGRRRLQGPVGSDVMDRLALEIDHFQVIHPFDAAASLGSLFIDGYHFSELGGRVVVDGLEPLVCGTLAPRVAA